MASYLSMNTKRKDLETNHHGHNGVSDFALSSPARKIRRLDADFSPVIQQEEWDMAMTFEQQPFREFRAADDGESRLRGLVIEELQVPPVADDQQRAIVLFEPINTPLSSSPSHFVVDSDLISSIKEQGVWGLNSNSSRPLEDRVSKADERLAIIPWVPSEQFHQVLAPEVSEMEISEPMDAEEVGATMEADDNTASSGAQLTNQCIHMNWSSEFVPQQWQQQHCMTPQPLQNTTTPIV